MYNRLVIEHYDNRIIDELVLDMAKYMMLTLLTSWRGMQYVQDVLTANSFVDSLSLFKVKALAQSLARLLNYKDILSNAKNWTRVIRRRGQVTCPSINAIRTLL